jgi:pilus assembly protein CpaB
VRRRLLGVLAAVGLASIGTAILVAYVSAARDRAEQGGRLVEALVVTEPIAKGTKATELADKVKVVKVPVGAKAAGAVDDLRSLEDKVATVSLLPGEQLVGGRFSSEAVLAEGIPADLLRVTLALDPERAMGGQLAVGDRVAVVASFPTEGEQQAVTHLVLHKVAVAGIQWEDPEKFDDAKQASTEGEKAASAPDGQLFVTLAAPAGDIERIVFASEHGTVWLSGEPTKADEGGTRVLSRTDALR